MMANVVRIHGDRAPRIAGFARKQGVQSGAGLWLTPITRSMFFTSLDDGSITALRRIAVRRSFASGQTIHMQDDAAHFLNVVTIGHVRLSYVMEDGLAVLHDVLPGGATFGEFGVFDRSAYPDMATAVGSVSLTSFPATALLGIAQVRPDLSEALHRAVANRYREYVALVRDLSLPSLSARLARTVIRVADRLSVRTEYEGRPALMIGGIVTQTDLGLMARGSRGNVNRTLQAWQRAGWIALQDRSIMVLDKAALAALASNDRD